MSKSPAGCRGMTAPVVPLTARRALLERLLDPEHVAIFDGAMGTMLYAKGVFINVCYDELNVQAPDLVLGVHEAYARAGAEVLETNSFGANRPKLAQYGSESRVRELNIAAAQLARRAAGEPLGALAAVGLVLVSTLAISWAMVLVAMLAANPEKVQIFGFVVLFPITFTSDAFVRTATMPGWLQAWSKANPVSLISDAVRGLMVSGPAARPAVEALLYAVAFTAVFAPLAVRAFKRRV